MLPVKPDSCNFPLFSIIFCKNRSRPVSGKGRMKKNQIRRISRPIRNKNAGNALFSPARRKGITLSDQLFYTCPIWPPRIRKSPIL